MSCLFPFLRKILCLREWISALKRGKIKVPLGYGLLNQIQIARQVEATQGTVSRPNA